MTEAEAYQRQIFAERAKKAEEHAAFSAVKPVLKVAGVPIGLQTGNNQLEKQADPDQLTKPDAPVLSLAKARTARRIRDGVADAVAHLERRWGTFLQGDSTQHVTSGGPLAKFATRDETGYLPPDPPRPVDRYGLPIPDPAPRPLTVKEIADQAAKAFMEAMAEALRNGVGLDNNGSAPLRMRTRPMDAKLEDGQ